MLPRLTVRAIANSATSGLFGKLMGFVRTAIEGAEGSAESGFAAVLCEGLKSSEIKAQRHSAKELSWLCGDDNRHLGMSGGAIHGNRLAVIQAGGLELLVPLLQGSDPKTTGVRRSASSLHLQFASMCCVCRRTHSLLQPPLPMLPEHVASALAGIMKHEPAAAMVHDLGGTAHLVDVYNRSAG